MNKDISNLNLFLDEQGNPLILTPGQKEIFDIIVTRKFKRVIVMCATQYGKSLTVALAILLRAVSFPERWVIVAPTEAKTRIIMNYILNHLSDNPIFSSQIFPKKQVERLRMEESKNRITFKRGGEIFILSADSRNRQRSGESLLGFGSPNVVLDESPHISDKAYPMIKRMLGSHKDNFLLEIGNPLRRNHFHKAWLSDDYVKIKIDCYQGIREGRFTEKYIEEMQKQPLFEQLYECKFPLEEAMDEEGWMPLLTEEEVEKAMVQRENRSMGIGVNKLGVDVAGGGRNYSAIVQRNADYAKIVHKSRNPDTMDLICEVVELIKEGVWGDDVAIDKVGVGKGAYDCLQKIYFGVQGINAGEGFESKDPAKEEFTNLRAKMFWAAREWIKKGGQLEKNEDWYQLAKIKYRSSFEGTKGKIQIMPKEEMFVQGIESPDIADAFALTFAAPDIVRMDKEEYEYRIRKEEEDFNRWNPFGFLS